MYAIVNNEMVTAHGELFDLFPNTSFPEQGPTSDWLLENNVSPVLVYLEFDSAKQRLKNVEPYFYSGKVYSVIVVDRDEQDIANERHNAIVNAISVSDHSILSSLSDDEKVTYFEVQANTVRERRDGMLAKSDWRVTKSYETNTNIPQEWLTYRQELRDISNQSGFPWNTLWPISPL